MEAVLLFCSGGVHPLFQFPLEIHTIEWWLQVFSAGLFLGSALDTVSMELSFVGCLPVSAGLGKG